MILKHCYLYILFVFWVLFGFNTFSQPHWVPQTSGTIQQLNSIYFLLANEGYAAGVSGTILHTTNGSINRLSMPSGTTQNMEKIFFTNPDNGWAVGEDGTILKYGRFLLFHSSQSEIDFGEVVDTTSKSENGIISNSGTDTLVISQISSDNAEFSYTPGTLTILPSTSDTLVVNFTPVGNGTRNGHIVLQHIAFSSPDTIHPHGTALDYDTMFIELRAGWNLISMPLLVSNDSVRILFPPAISDAFRYDVATGYQSLPIMELGIGYWVSVS